jgi:hypothetical protein
VRSPTQRPGRLLLNTTADRLQPDRVAAGRQLGQHPLQGQLVQQLAAGERLPGGQSQLSDAVGGADPRPVDPNPSAAESDLAGLGAVADRDPVGLMAALGAGQPLHVGVQQAPQHAQAGPHGKGEQALAGGAGQLSQRHRNPFRQHQLGIGGQGRLRILRHVAVPFWSSSLVVARPLPHGRHQAGTATSSSTKSGTISCEQTDLLPHQRWVQLIGLDRHGLEMEPRWGDALSARNIVAPGAAAIDLGLRVARVVTS